MNLTGERMIPAASDPSTFWEHIYRYAFASRFVVGCRTLDVACGTGYGSAALAMAGATQVVGIDVSAEACAYAAAEYGVDARVGDATNLPIGDAAFDAVVSFETIEHIPEPLRFLDECVRVLRPGGTLVISTPNKALYREITPNNPFHVHELEQGEFQRACRCRFSRVRFYSQRPLRAPWWSARGTAATFWAPTRIPGVIRARNRLVRALYPQFMYDWLENARQHPVDAIRTLAAERHTIANPYAIRRNFRLKLDDPVYLLAVCTKANGA